jgi:hypothetical protein
MNCPYCHGPLHPETPCGAQAPVPMSYWPSRSQQEEMVELKAGEPRIAQSAD